jgi:Kef-type K+ transport system membrane component KefB
MIERIRFTWQLLVLASVLVLLGLLCIPRIQVEIPPATFLIILLSVTAINFITYLVMSAGIKKNNREGVVYLLAGIGIKFFLYLLFILISWSATKNLTKAFILTFFALYLIFTFFTATHLFKLLKNKQLHQS